MTKRIDPALPEFLDLIFTETSKEVVKTLASLGFCAYLDEHGVLMMLGKRNFRAGLHWESTDYPTRRTQLGFVLFGIPSYLDAKYPTLDQEMQKRWTATRKAKKSKV